LRALPDGKRKADEAKRMIDLVRTFIGYREYPKYGMVSRYFEYKQALLGEAERLVQAHVLRESEDIFYLTFQELHALVIGLAVSGGTVEDGPASSWTWRRPSSNRATSWSRPTRTQLDPLFVTIKGPVTEVGG